MTFFFLQWNIDGVTLVICGQQCYLPELIKRSYIWIFVDPRQANPIHLNPALFGYPLHYTTSWLNSQRFCLGPSRIKKLPSKLIPRVSLAERLNIHELWKKIENMADQKLFFVHLATSLSYTQPSDILYIYIPECEQHLSSAHLSICNSSLWGLRG